ncbi:hypothetical protein ALC56_11227 [Trachymyrmex septentrionalis]|uniref:Uncharacterized protein n=1 Tax=Trachymyrmex septentrionalis TaxID=34720 RepID=A0A195F2Q2_9HYME|nr:hypothetical protein ALC56_11227 [Trachymyrmex septentrionalis]
MRLTTDGIRDNPGKQQDVVTFSRDRNSSKCVIRCEPGTRASPFASDTCKTALPRLFVRRQRIEVTMGGQWLRRRGEKEQKGIGDDRLEKTVSGSFCVPVIVGQAEPARLRDNGQRAWKGERKWIYEGVKGSLESARNEENMRDKDGETRRGSTHGGSFRLLPVNYSLKFRVQKSFGQEYRRANSITRLVRAATPKKKDPWFGCKPQRRAATGYLVPGSRRYSRCGLPTPVALIHSGLGGVGDERARCNTDVSHQNSQTDNVGAERAAVTGLLHILARTSKRALRLPEIQPRVSGKRG